MRFRLVMAALAVVMVTACATKEEVRTGPMGPTGAGDRELVRSSESSVPLWVDKIGQYQKKETNAVFASGAVQGARNREHAKRDAEMIAKRNLAENLGQRIVSRYVAARSGERGPDDVDASSEFIEDAIGAQTDQVIYGARPIEYYWEEWKLKQVDGTFRTSYEVSALVALDPESARRVAADMMKRAEKKLQAEHREKASQLVEEMRNRLNADPDAVRVLQGLPE